VDEDYLAINAANWDSRAPLHARAYGIERYLDDPTALSDVVRFDGALLGDIAGLDTVHLQCHIGTDTLSLHRLGARMTGVDLSGASIDHARQLAADAGADITYVQSDVYSAPEALEHCTYDLVYTGIGAICWLPSIERWARTVAERVAGHDRRRRPSGPRSAVLDQRPGRRDDRARAAVLGAAARHGVERRGHLRRR
jgi:2-polyprenyl-3-methyl-5-hydroxy-6-metoxy-1,4-benzoquinol methylase